jgi:hypothetical protein
MNNTYTLIEYIVSNWPFLNEAMNPKEVQTLTQKFKDEADDFNITISDEDIKNAINIFDTKFKQDPNVTEKDLRTYSLTQLLKLISAKPGFEKEKAERKIEDTPDIVYNEDGIVIYSGDVEGKCIKYGAGEKWCITKGSYGNYRFDPNRGYPIFYLVKNTNLPDSDPLSFVAIQVRNNGEYVYTNRLNNPHESNQMSFNSLLDEVPYLTSIDDLKSIGELCNPCDLEKETLVIKTGLSVEIPNGYFMSIVPRSSTGIKTPLRLANSVGIIDSDYRGELGLIFTNTNDDSLYNYDTVYGENGRIVKKSVTTPYNLNPNNYIFLVIPNLNHIESIQNNNITDNAFAKILLPGDSNRVLFNTYVSSQKIYYDYLFNNLNDLEIAFVTNSGDLFDFNGSDLSFSLEITEIIDKLDYINPRFGNIEF